MAAKYLRKQTWWVRFYDPRTSYLVRESLGTGDEAKAELLRQRVELEAALLNPRFQAAEVPDNVRKALGWVPSASVPEWSPKNETRLEVVPEPSIPIRPAARVLLDDALRGYFAFIRTENAVRHVENKLSMLRRFLGGDRAEAFVKGADCAARTRRLKNASEAFFTGTYLDEITPSLLQEFFDLAGSAPQDRAPPPHCIQASAGALAGSLYHEAGRALDEAPRG